jgi:hypothetical protein
MATSKRAKLKARIKGKVGTPTVLRKGGAHTDKSKEIPRKAKHKEVHRDEG